MVGKIRELGSTKRGFCRNILNWAFEIIGTMYTPMKKMFQCFHRCLYYFYCCRRDNEHIDTFKSWWMKNMMSPHTKIFLSLRQTSQNFTHHCSPPFVGWFHLLDLGGSVRGHHDHGVGVVVPQQLLQVHQHRTLLNLTKVGIIEQLLTSSHDWTDSSEQLSTLKK